MSGNTVGSIVGAAAGFVISGGNPAGAKWGFMLGGMIGGYVDPVKIKGPRLSDATRQTSQEGVPIPWGYGTFPTTGNIIFAGPLVEHEHKEGGKGGPQTISYSYTRSYALGICEGPISGIQKIKRNGKLVYDISPGSTIAGENGKFLEKCTIYLGDETQMVDPTIEAIVGVGNTGPYRGLAYIVLEDDDLTDSQGAIAQYEFVVQMCGTLTETSPDYLLSLGPAFYYPLTEGGSSGEDITGNLPDLAFDGDYTSGGSLTFNDLGANASCITGSGALEGSNYISIFVKVRVNSTGGTTGTMIAGIVNNSIFGYTEWSITLRGPNALTPYIDINNMGGAGQGLGAPFELAVGTEYVMGLRRNGAVFELLIDGTVVNSCPCAGSFGGSATLFSGGHFYPTSYGGHITVSHLVGVARAVSDEEAALVNMYLQVPRAGIYAVPDLPGAYTNQDGTVYTPGVATQAITSCDEILGVIFDDLCDRSGIDVASEVDSSQLTDLVKGFKCATESSADAFIESLTLAHFFDRGEWDKKVRGIKRGGTNLFALTPNDLVSRDGPAIDWTQIQEAELLRKVNVLSIDPAADYNMTKQSWERRAGTIQAKGEASIEIPEVVVTDTAAQIAEIRGKIAWAENAKVRFGLSVKWSKLTPTDPGTFTDKNGLAHRIRLADLNEEQGVFSVEEASKDRAAIYTGTVTGVTNSNTPGPTSPGLIGPTLFVAMNLPQMRTQDGAGLYVGMVGLLPGWHGAQLLMSVDSGVSYQAVLTINTPTIMGPLTASVDASGSASEPLSVHIYGGTLSSATGAQVAQGINTSAVLTDNSAGPIAEVLAYEVANETAAGYYDLSILSRGLNGTTPDDHYTGDMFMDMSTAYFVPIDTSYAGQTLYFKAVGLGVSADAVTAVPVVYEPQAVIIDGGLIT